MRFNTDYLKNKIHVMPKFNKPKSDGIRFKRQEEALANFLAPKKEIQAKRESAIRHSKIEQQKQKEEVRIAQKYPEKEINVSERTVAETAQDDGFNAGSNASGGATRKKTKMFSSLDKKTSSFWSRGPQKETDLKIKEKRTGIKIMVISGSSLAVVTLILASTVFAGLTVKITPKIEEMKVGSVLAAFDSSVSQIMAVQKVIPAEKLEMTNAVSQDFEATGKKDISQKSEGRVRIYNSYSSSPQKLVATTRFTAPDGKIYRMPQALTVPGAKIEGGTIIPQYVETTLLADKAGEEYNLEGKDIKLKIPGFIDTPKYGSFYGVAVSGFAGGFIGETKVISKEDLERAQKETTKNAYDEIKEEITKKIPQDFKLLEGLTEIQITNVDSPKENSKADTFSMKVQAKARAIVFRESDGIELVRETLLKDSPDKIYLKNSADINYKIESVNFDKGRATVSLGGVIKTESLVAEKELADVMKGQKEGSIINFLESQKDLSNFQVRFFPPWNSQAPKDPNKINMVNEGFSSK